jgi:hypothetical protein
MFLSDVRTRQALADHRGHRVPGAGGRVLRLFLDRGADRGRVGLSPRFRISYAADATLEAACARIHRFCAALA